MGGHCFLSWLGTVQLNQSPTPGTEQPRAIRWGALTVRPQGLTVLTTALEHFESHAQISL